MTIYKKISGLSDNGLYPRIWLFSLLCDIINHYTEMENTVKYEAVIFDFDFTLADASPGIIGSANYALRGLSFDECGDEEIKKTVGLTLKETFAALTGVYDEALAEKFAVLFREKADVIMTAGTALFPDTIAALSALKAVGVKTAIVTSKFHYRIDETLTKHSIAHLIDHIIGFEDVKAAKPSPEGLLNTIEYLRADKSGVLYVGDSLIDAETAKNAGVDFAAVTTGTTAALDFQQLPHVAIAGNLSELLDTLK